LQRQRPCLVAKTAIDEGLTVEPGRPIDIVVTAGADVVGRGQMTVHDQQDQERS